MSLDPAPRPGRPARPGDDLPAPAVASEEYDSDYFRHRCAGSTEWSTSEGRERDALYDGSLDRAGFRSGQALLDIGTGRGEMLIAALERGASRAVGVEYADAALELAHTTLAQTEIGRRAELVRADARALPLEDAGFDLVTMLDVVEHLTASELTRSLAEARRVLRPGGKIFIHTFPTRTLYNITYRLQRAIRPSRWRAWPVNPRSPDEQKMHVGEQSLGSLRTCLRAAGFREVAVEHGLWIHDVFIPDPRARRTYHRLARIPWIRRFVIADLWASAIR